ncbi:MAG: hypothetical protein A2Z19_06055 [Deltaproteobacteria bacterium RBG_16_54_18]|nr:MAG: hypothetical protein A2Z19_06055 [Deltaproteobacteria bacterium RBG_16_54_18]
MYKSYRVREVKKGKKWVWPAIVILILGTACFGYFSEYRPRVKAKNYASYVMVTVTGVEFKLQNFMAGDAGKQEKIFASMSSLWNKFEKIDPPDENRTFTIMWKMAKIFEYTKKFMEHELKKGGGLTTAEGTISPKEIAERISELKFFIDETIEYGNFKRWN